MHSQDARTVVVLDMAHYSAILESLEVGHGLGIDAAQMLNDQIADLIRQAAEESDSVFEFDVVFEEVHVKGTGDGAILVFRRAEVADRFAQALHEISDRRHNQTARKNQQKNQHRSFRIGISTGEVHRTADDVAGLAVVHAARLEAAARTGEILIDSQSWKYLSEARQNAYGEVEDIPGKDHDPPLEARRRQVVERAPWHQPGRGGRHSADPSPVLSPNEEQLVDEVFDTLRRNPIVLLLAQDGRAERAVLERILERAGALRRAIRVNLPAASVPDLGRYFATIARRCGFEEEIHDPFDWEDALDRRLRDGESLFLLVNGFEKGSEEGRRQLGRILHSCSQAHRPKLWMVLSGGERLAALKYEMDAHSVLKSGEHLEWPDPDAGDVLAWLRRESPEQTLSRAEAEEVLTLCGGHPRLIRHCLDRRHRGEPDDLTSCKAVWQNFTRYEHHTSARQRLHAWLRKNDLGQARPWIGDKLKRRLYWANALAARGDKLFWRCDAVREIGRRVFRWE